MPEPHTLRYCLLASGSGGNATVVEWGHTRLLIDAGLSARELTRRAAAVGFDLSDFTAILVSHEHRDHISGAGALARRFGLPLYGTHGTMQEGERILGRVGDVRPFQVGEALSFGDLVVRPFRTPHDVADGCSFIFDTPVGRLGWAMDLGSVTTLVQEKLKGCRALVLEFNHDETMVRDGSRPWPVKQRILSDHGHLSNAAAAELLAGVAHGELDQVVVAHISRDHNTPERARECIARTLATRPECCPDVAVASQFEPTPVFVLARPPVSVPDPT